MKEEVKPALQVIVLGSGGGPQESNTTAFLVRSISQNWRKGSVIAVDAGVHLSAITRILKSSLDALPSPPTSLPHTLTEGPFAGLSLPYASADANAGFITSSLIEAYLITHPHLDHIAGFVISTAGPPGVRPKKLAGLPGTIHAFKTHIFNNVIWPNLSDESNGAGLVTYLRLVEGGSPALGDGEGKGYSEICDGLLVKIWGVSHGHCIERHSHRGSASSASGPFATSQDSLINQQAQQPLQGSRRDPFTHVSAQATPRRQSLLSQATFGSSGGGGGSAGSPHGLGAAGEQEKFCVYDSSAYFIQAQDERREVLIFGDVEPDSLSLSPRNLQIWQEAAPKIAAETLAAIFIECSYDDSRDNDRLFGHLKPVFVIEELRVLAAEVGAAKKAKVSLQDSTKKRKRMSDAALGPRSVPRQSTEEVVHAVHAEDPASPVSPKTHSVGVHDALPVQSAGKSLGPRTDSAPTYHLATPTRELSLREEELGGAMGSSPSFGEISTKGQLEGLKVVIIHVKEKLDDGPDVGETILTELLEHEKEAQLGCEFVIARSGQAFYF